MKMILSLVHPAIGHTNGHCRISQVSRAGKRNFTPATRICTGIAAPFFLYLAYNAVHTPLQAPEKYLSRCAGIADEKRRTLAAMCVAMDDGIGRVLQALRDSGIERDTLVFFLSDNGGPITVVPCGNAPLRGGKGSVYEGGIRVPFVAQWRGHLSHDVLHWRSCQQ